MNNGRSDDERPTAKASTIPPPLPPFRSVRMNVGPAPVMVQQQHETAKQPPMMPGRNPVVQGKMMAPPPPKPVAFSSNPAIPSNNNSFSTNNQFVWKVQGLHRVPIYHPLERTAVTFGNEHPLDLITERISGFLKQQSIFASYEETRVVCSTSCCLHFSIQLWQKNDGNTIIMEMQRKQGCAIRMQSLRQQLKDSILFYGVKPTQESSAPSASLKQQLARMVPPIPAAASEEQGSCMELCQEMLSSNLLDQNRMGLESLCILTDASKVQDAAQASDKVLQDSKLQMSLIKYFAASPEDKNLHLLAIKAVAQALEACSASCKIVLGSVFWQTVLQTLYQHIQRPHEKPLEACFCIKALRLLSDKCPECLDVLQRKHSLPVTAFLQIAHEFGKQHSSSLEREAMQFMMANVH